MIALCHVRFARQPDLDRMIEIESASFGDPWDRSRLLAALRSSTEVFMVAETRSGLVLGYISYHVRRHCIRVVRMAVAPESRRKGVGRAILEKAVVKVIALQLPAIVAKVPGDNLPAHILMRSAGFDAVGVDQVNDEYWFERKPTDRERGERGYQPLFGSEPVEDIGGES